MSASKAEEKYGFIRSGKSNAPSEREHNEEPVAEND
jgi:hypothetical protein